MTKTAAPTLSSALDQARAELARREQRRDADLAQFGSASSDDISAQGRHRRKRQEMHQALIHQAYTGLKRLELVDALNQVKAAAQADIEQAQASLKVRQADVQREAAALAEVTARATALEGQIAQLEAGRHAGLDAAQAVLTERTQASDLAGAASAAEEVARIEAVAASVTARLRPLQLQLTAVGELKTAAEARLRKAEGVSNDADKVLAEARLEALAIVRDAAALAFREAHLAFLVADNRPTRSNLTVEFDIGASSRLLHALGNGWDKLIPVTRYTLEQMGQELRTSEAAAEAIFAEDPSTMEDMTVVRARRAASAARVGVTLTEPA